MASSPFIFSALTLFIFTLSPSSSFAKLSSRPNALVLPITKDKTTLQYTTVINMGSSRDEPGTPLVAGSFVFDLGGRHLWVETDTLYWSTSFQTSHCNSPMCYHAGSHGCSRCYSDYRPGCNADPCTLTFKSPVNGIVETGDIASEVVFIQSTNGSNPGRVVKIPSLIFSLGTRDLLNGLANGTVGMAGMGRCDVIGLPSQFAKAFGFNRKGIKDSNTGIRNKGLRWIFSSMLWPKPYKKYINSHHRQVKHFAPKYPYKILRFGIIPRVLYQMQRGNGGGAVNKLRQQQGFIRCVELSKQIITTQHRYIKQAETSQVTTQHKTKPN